MAEPDEFARLLRGWRRRTAPVASGPRRRTPGLRREELAVEAGVSADYIVQLEQGRAQRPSAPIVAALARSLRLAPEETHAFFLAAGLAEPDKRIDRVLDPRLSRLLTRAEHIGAAVYSADWWLLGWNRLWSALLGDPANSTGFERDLVWQVFTRDDWRPLPRDRSLQELKQSLAEDLRSATLEHPLDERLAELVGELLRTRPQFASAWEQALAGQHPAERKTLRHPTAGELFLDADTFQFRDTDQHLVVYSAEPGSDDEERLAALADPGADAGSARG